MGGRKEKKTKGRRKEGVKGGRKPLPKPTKLLQI